MLKLIILIAIVVYAVNHVPTLGQLWGKLKDRVLSLLG